MGSCLKKSEPESNISLYQQPTLREHLEAEKKILQFKDFKGFKKLSTVVDCEEGETQGLIYKRYEIQEELGQGSFGQVNKALHLKAGVECAIKRIEKQKVAQHQIYVELMQNELHVLEETTHPNIMRIFELLEDDEYYYIVSEFIQGGELYQRILDLKNFNERSAAYIIQQLLLAINYMHSNSIIHRDIKPENILMESSDLQNFNIKVTDFGFACFCTPGEGEEEGKQQEQLGSPLYMAPEVVNEEKYDAKVDVWAVGVLTYILLSGGPPFRGRQRNDIFNSIKNAPLQFDRPVWNRVSEEAKQFITLALQRDINERPTAAQLLENAWIQGQVQVPEVEEDLQVEVAQNLQEFKNSTVFQNAVLSFLVSVKTTSEELSQLNQLFVRLDTSKDGKLQIEELKDGMDQIMGLDLKGYFDVMSELDVNKDGVIDYTEFITAAINKVQLLNNENLLAAFKLIDRDNSGMITKDELQVAFDSNKVKDPQLWEDIMKEVDTNNDDQISMEEFAHAMTNYLKKTHLPVVEVKAELNASPEAKSGGSKQGSAKAKKGKGKKK